MNQVIELILFDLGGVLIELHGSPLPMCEMAFSDWFCSETAREFEKGLVSPSDFANKMKEDLGLAESVEEIISYFKEWPKGFYPGATEFLVRLKKRYRVAALSNTNAIHWPRITKEFQAPLYFERIIASHQVGMAKPDAMFYVYALEELAVNSENVLFLDDRAQNVAAAKEVGMNACVTQGFSSVLEVLSTMEILRS